MRDWDLEVFAALLKRPGLYMGTNDWNEVERFIRAYELGANWKCDFMYLLTNQVDDKYGVSMPPKGLIEQLKIASKTIDQTWEELFVKETKEILIIESDKNNKNRFQKILRNKILAYFKEVPELIDSAYFGNLIQINRQIDDWPGKNLSEEEINLVKVIREELSSEVSIHLTEKFKPNEMLKSKILELKILVRKENESG
jgi:hypothetical protein